MFFIAINSLLIIIVLDGGSKLLLFHMGHLLVVPAAAADFGLMELAFSELHNNSSHISLLEAYQSYLVR